MVSSNGYPIRKPWRFVTSNAQQAFALQAFKCTHKASEHVEAAGKETKRTEIYPIALATAMLESLFPHAGRVPAMSCEPALPSEHIPKETQAAGFVPSPFMWSEIFEINARKRGHYKLEHDELLDCSLYENKNPDTDNCLTKTTNIAVTKSLSREEIQKCPEVQKAIRKEAECLLALKTWDQDSHIEKDDLIKDALKKGIRLIIGDLLILGSIKFFERAREYWKFKGRICYRGDSAKDQSGAWAVYQELHAAPTGIHSANSNLAYGMLPGNKTTQADAIRAYCQALLKSKDPTWVTIPPLLRRKDMKEFRPCCRLLKALYGHPESGAHWEKHLTSAIHKCGGVAILNHPSSFWIKPLKIMLTVYVDDLLCSGPLASHAKFWKMLTDPNVGGISIDDPEPLDRFLGRKHVVLHGSPKKH